MRNGVRKEYLDGTRRHGNYRFPINKFLESRLGCFWDDVHSEMSTEFDRRTYAGHRFWGSFGRGYYSDVEENCWIGAETGTIYDSRDQRVTGYYVHPTTGVLSYQKPLVRAPYIDPPVTFIKLNEKHAYEKLEGIWYRVDWVKNDWYKPYQRFNENLTEDEKNFYCKQYTTTNKRQLSRKQLRAAGLQNDAIEG